MGRGGFGNIPSIMKNDVNHRMCPRGSGWRAGVAALAVVVCAVMGCEPGESRPRPKGPNVLIVLVDTLRADKLGCYGNDLGLTPTIDGLAAEGVRFENAFAHAPWTLPSCGSLFTSALPSCHGGGGYLGQAFTAVREDQPTLAEAFQRAGYQTAAFVNVMFLDPKFGLKRGFTHYDFTRPRNNMGERKATPTTDAATVWLKAHAGEPFFLVVHYFDPHLTYDPPAEYRKKYAMAIDHTRQPDLFGEARQMRALRQGAISIDAVPLERLERLYHGEVSYADREIGRLLGSLEGLGVREDTIVVFTADHGEEFGEHGGFEHGHTVYDELLHVPLIIHYPRKLAARVIPTVVRHIDVGPTICELAGVEAPASFAGHPLSSLLEGRMSADRVAVSEGNMWGPTRACMRKDGYKLIRHSDTGNVELYKTAIDPGELLNLAGDREQADRVKEMAGELDQALREAAAAGGDGAALELTPAEKKNLDAIGYIGEDRDAGSQERKTGR